MPTKIRRLTRAPKPEVSDTLRRFLESGERVKGNALTFILSGHPDRLQTTWAKVRREMMTTWLKAHPCTRPWSWWLCDAPAEPVPGWPGFEAAQRLRVGGLGQVTHEVSCSWAGFSFGVPNGWLDAQGAELFGGIAVDPNDPPRYESQGQYLSRHNLLSESERRHLEKHPELREPERVVFDDDEGQAPNSLRTDPNVMS